MFLPFLISSLALSKRQQLLAFCLWRSIYEFLCFSFSFATRTSILNLHPILVRLNVFLRRNGCEILFRRRRPIFAPFFESLVVSWSTHAVYFLCCYLRRDTWEKVSSGLFPRSEELFIDFCRFCLPSPFRAIIQKVLIVASAHRSHHKKRHRKEFLIDGGELFVPLEVWQAQKTIHFRRLNLRFII